MIHRTRLPSRPKLRPLLAVALIAASAAAQGQSCAFRTVGSAINFPALNPSTAVTVTTSMDVVVRCNPASVTPAWQFSGANGSTPLRMKHATQNVFIAYTIAAKFVSGSVNETWRITGTILGANYQNALVGSYTDILTATITP